MPRRIKGLRYGISTANTNCFKRDDIKNEMAFDIIVILSSYGYPPVGENYEEVYKKVIEQAENYKKNT